MSIFDSLPFIIGNYDKRPINRIAQSTFLDMVEAKKPDVVISCFRSDTDLENIKLLQGHGIGKTAPSPQSFITPDHQFTRVNAFHPSFAMNRVLTESCSKRLLVLEFAQGFGTWRKSWKEEKWMEDLRKLCQERGRLYSDK